MPVFVASEENLHADAASRLQSLPDWHLPRLLFDRDPLGLACHRSFRDEGFDASGESGRGEDNPPPRLQ